MRFTFMFYSKGMKTKKAKKITIFINVIPLNNTDSFFTVR